jgi:hypothetical protein
LSPLRSWGVHHSYQLHSQMMMWPLKSTPPLRHWTIQPSFVFKKSVIKYL